MMLISPFIGNLKRKRPIKSSRMDNPIVRVNFNLPKVEQFHTRGAHAGAMAQVKRKGIPSRYVMIRYLKALEKKTRETDKATSESHNLRPCDLRRESKISQAI